MVTKTVKGQGGEYVPTPAPQSGDIKDLRDWMVRETAAIANAMLEGRCNWIRADTLATAPTRAVKGMICYFLPDAVAPGSLQGVWEYDGTNWNRT